MNENLAVDLEEEYLTLNDVLEARERIRDICVYTKLIYSTEYSKESGNEIYIKPENLQLTGAFKIRGALNKVGKLSDEKKSKGLISASAGNHAGPNACLVTSNPGLDDRRCSPTGIAKKIECKRLILLRLGLK